MLDIIEDDMVVKYVKAVEGNPCRYAQSSYGLNMQNCFFQNCCSIEMMLFRFLL